MQKMRRLYGRRIGKRFKEKRRYMFWMTTRGMVYDRASFEISFNGNNKK